MAKKNLFNAITGIFKTDDNMNTIKNAKINACTSMPRLEVGGKCKELSNKAFGIGRDKYNQLIIADPMVSRFHAVVTFENDEASIKDTDSSNGTYVNNKKVEQGKKYKLKNGDKIKVGTTVIIYYR